MLMVTTINSLTISACTLTCLLLLHLIKMFIWSKPPGCKLVSLGIKAQSKNSSPELQHTGLHSFVRLGVRRACLRLGLAKIKGPAPGYM